MRFLLTYDANWEAKIDVVLTRLGETGFKTMFEKKNYGASVEVIGIVLMCRNPSLNFKQRIRYVKAEKELYLDIMLDFYQFEKIEQTERNKIVAEKLIKEVPIIIAKYKFKDFDLPKFEADLTKCFKKVL